MIDREEIERLDEFFAKRFENECKKNNPDVDHVAADGILCDILSQLGFYKTVEKFNDLEKWYG